MEIVESARLPGWRTRSNCLSRYHLPVTFTPLSLTCLTLHLLLLWTLSLGQQSPFPTFAPAISSMVKINTDQVSTGGESGFTIKPIILLDSAVLLLLSHPRCPIPSFPPIWCVCRAKLTPIHTNTSSHKTIYSRTLYLLWVHPIWHYESMGKVNTAMY